RSFRKSLRQSRSSEEIMKNKTEETALVRDNALFRSGSRRIADAMALLIGAKKLKWNPRKHSYVGVTVVDKFQGAVGKPGSVGRTKMNVAILSRKNKKRKRDESMYGDPGLPFG